MIEKITAKANGWIAHWGEAVFSPKQYFSNSRASDSVASLGFYVGNMFIAYTITFFISLVYFSIFHIDTLQDKFVPRIEQDFSYISELFAVYAVLIFIALLISSIISFIVAKVLRSKASFSKHVALYLRLTAIEPIAALSSALIFLSDREGWLFIFAILIFLFSRVWGLNAGYHGFMKEHATSSRVKWVYSLGYVPSQLIFNTILLAFMWMMMSWGIVKYWD